MGAKTTPTTPTTPSAGRGYGPGRAGFLVHAYGQTRDQPHVYRVAWHRAIVIGLLGAYALTTSACLQPTGAQIDRWASAGKTDRLLATVRRPGTAPELRARAASALLGAGRSAQVLPALAQLPEGERGPVVAYLLHSFLPSMLSSNPAAAQEGLFALRRIVSPDRRIRTDRLLTRSFVKELMDRGTRAPSLIGDRLRVVAASDPSLLLPLLDTPEPPYDLVLDTVVHAPRSLEMARTRLTARLRQTPQPDEALWIALARSGATEFLRDTVAAGKEDAALAARALAQAPADVRLAHFALEQLENRERDPHLRSSLVQMVHDGADASLLPALLKVLRRETDRQVTQVLFGAAVRAGGAAGAVKALEALPDRSRYLRDEIVSALVEPICALGAEARAVARESIRSRSVLARLTAVLVLDRVGEPGDAELLKRLRRDTSRLPGWAPDERLHKEAARVGAQLAARASAGPSSQMVQQTAGAGRSTADVTMPAGASPQM